MTPALVTYGRGGSLMEKTWQAPYETRMATLLAAILLRHPIVSEF